MPSLQYAPTGHVVQPETSLTPARAFKVPAGHFSAVALSLPSGQKWPGSQTPEHLKSPLPRTSPYEPAGHGAGLTDPEMQKWPRGQAWQSLGAVLPVSPLKVPDVQGVAVGAPVGQTCPAGHMMGLLVPAGQ